MHYGILGMKWGVRRTPEQLGHFSRRDIRWANRNRAKITKAAKKSVNRELGEYANELLRQPNARTSRGKLSASTINAYNKKMAELMNEKVSSISSPSGKAVRFVAKRGEIGVHMALTDPGFDMDQVRNGVWGSGRIAYRKTTLKKA